MLVPCLLQYSDTQSYGVAAIFGLVTDLKLYSITNDFHLDLNKYQLSKSVANLGSMFVRARLKEADNYSRHSTLFSSSPNSSR
jgi:ACS family allantoate permease-like MFS transporter